MSDWIDLRSDTVTRPTSKMRAVMAEAEVGDDVWGDDPSVNRLEDFAAERLEKEAAVFTPSTTQSNLIALLTHCGRGDEVILGQEAHNYLYEGGGGATLGGIQPQPMLQEPDGTLDLERISQLVKPDDYHFARTRLLCLENTTWGKILPHHYPVQACELAERQGLKSHLDGARIFNASIGCDVDASELVAPFDSVSICLSKGLGAPVGSLLLGSKEFIGEARRWRKMLGGGMRQAGIIAAAGQYALENHVKRLADDHDNARFLARGFTDAGFICDPVHTNMVFVDTGKIDPEEFASFLKEYGILTLGYTGEKMRLVTHLDVSHSQISRVIEIAGKFPGLKR